MSVRIIQSYKDLGYPATDYRAWDHGDRGRGMKYGRYRDPFPLDVIPVLRRKHYPCGDRGLLQMPFYPEPVNVARCIPSGEDLYTENRKRLTYQATAQWTEEVPGRGSARHSNAYRQFAGMGAPFDVAGMGDLSDDIKTIIDRSVGGKLSQVSGKLDDVGTALKVSTGAALLTAAVTLYVAFGRRR